MNDQSCAPVAAEDAVWVSIETPLDVESLKSFCQDIERMFRINPMLIFKDWQADEYHHYRFSGQNISQEEPFDFDLTLTVQELPDGLQIEYLQGIKSSTTFKIEPTPPGSEWKSQLTITENYDGMPEQERKKHLHTVDKSITVWAKYLQQYFLSWQRWSRFRLWRWYMRRVWQPMNPSGRRITYMLLWITAFEIALITLGFTIYYIEYA